MFKINKKRCQKDVSSGAFIIDFEHTSHLSLAFLLLTFKQGNICWEATFKNYLCSLNTYDG